MKIVSLICATLIAMLFFSCVTVSVDDGSQVYEEGYRSLPVWDNYTRVRNSGEVIQRRPDYVRWTTTLFGGIIPIGPDRDANAICGSGSEAVQIEHEWNLGHGFLTAVTGGIWWPKTLKIWCS